MRWTRRPLDDKWNHSSNIQTSAEHFSVVFRRWCFNALRTDGDFCQQGWDTVIFKIVFSNSDNALDVKK
jgi:hypothetical protein